jgi:hypothetical protein
MGEASELFKKIAEEENNFKECKAKINTVESEFNSGKINEKEYLSRKDDLQTSLDISTLLCDYYKARYEELIQTSIDVESLYIRMDI